jgi:DNA-binding transcriptional regulator GbsR (MarR family)
LIPTQFVESFRKIVNGIIVIALFEFSFRAVFIIKRRFWPVSEKILEDEIETEVEAITKAHFKKMEEKEKKLENKIDELMKKLRDTEKENS